MPKLSIIIPIYNSDKFLKECLDSICIQKFDDYEVLLINDGSKDKSGIICDEYAKKDNRFRVFHKENEGVSSARNFALDNAKGQWIHFVDADDYLLTNEVYDTLFNPTNEKKNVIRFGFKWGIYTKILPDDNKNYDDKDRVISVIRSTHGYLWCNLFKKEAIGNIRFEQMSFAEDALFLNQVLVKEFSIAFVDKLLYFYRINPDSALRGKYMESFFSDSLFLEKKLKEIHKESSVYDCLASGWATLTRFYFGLMNEIKRNNIKASVATLNEYYDKLEIKKLIDERSLKDCMKFNNNWFFIRYRMFYLLLLLHPVAHNIKQRIKRKKNKK